MGIEPVEDVSDAVEDIAPELAALVGGIPYYIKLHIEEFSKALAVKMQQETRIGALVIDSKPIQNEFILPLLGRSLPAV